jgi:hypothetical protein
LGTKNSFCSPFSISERLIAARAQDPDRSRRPGPPEDSPILPPLVLGEPIESMTGRWASQRLALELSALTGLDL